MKYQVFERNQITGPYTIEELRAKLAAGELTGDDRVCAEGTQSWLPLDSILQSAANSPQPSPPPLAQAPRKKSGCGCVLTGLMICGVLALIFLCSSYYVLFRTPLPLRWFEKALSGPNFSIQGISGSLSSGFTVEKIHCQSDQGDLFEAENLKLTYSDLANIGQTNELILNELSVGKARIIVSSSSVEATSTTSYSSNTRGPSSSSPRTRTSTHRSSAPNGLKLFRIDRIHFNNVYAKDRTTGFEMTMPEFDYSGFQWTPSGIDLGNLRIDTDRLEATTQPGKTILIDGRPVTFQKSINGTLKPLLNPSIKDPIAFHLDVGLGDNNRLFYRFTALDGKAEMYFDEFRAGYYKARNLPLTTYLSAAPYDLPDTLTLDVRMTESQDARLDQEHLPSGRLTLGVTDFVIQPDQTVTDETSDHYRYKFKAIHKTAAGEITATLQLQSMEPRVLPSFSSTPAMEPKDLLATIFFGKPYADISPEARQATDARIPVYFPATKGDTLEK